MPASHTAPSVCFSQSESEEKVVTYDHIGPNVCMGDHKVMRQPRPGGGGRGGPAGLDLRAWWLLLCLLGLAAQDRPRRLLSLNFNKIPGGGQLGG